MITLKSNREIEAMNESGALLASIHVALRDFIKPGVTTWEIDQFVQKKIEEAAAYIYKYQNKIIISDNTNTIQEAIEYMGKSDNGRKTLQNCRFVFLNYVDREKIAKLSKQYNFKYSYPKPDK